MNTPSSVTTEPELEELLSRPSPVSVDAMRRMEGDLLILGAGGKMGPSLARLARRSADDADRRDLRVVAVSRFSSSARRSELEADGIEVLARDLLDANDRTALPATPNVLFMFGHKFSGDGTDGPERYWAMNVYLPGLLAEQFRDSRIVCFSSGNVYPFTPLGKPAPVESTPPQPRGEYATTVWGRERMMQYASDRHGTPVCLLRLNYAVEARYGVLVDVAEKILARQPIDLSVPELNFIWQGHANAVALGAFALTNSPAEIINLTGTKRHRVRDLATELGERLGVEPLFAGEEGAEALVSDASRCHSQFGPSTLDDEAVLDLTAAWLTAGGATLGKPTKFQVQDGRY